MTSTSVATNGADEVAGSKPNFFRINGNIEPESVPHKTTPISEKKDSNSYKQPVWPVDVRED